MPLLALLASAQRDRAGGRDRAVVGEARAGFGQLGDQVRRHAGDALHVARVLRVQHAAGDGVADLVAVVDHFRALAQHVAGDGEVAQQDRRRAFFLGQLQRDFPAGHGHLARDVLGERAPRRRCRSACLSMVTVEPRPRKPMPWRRLPMISSRCCSSGRPLISTTLSSMRVNTLHHLAVFVPVEARLRAERIAHEGGQVDRAEQARAVRRQRLFAARIGRADVLAPPVVVHLVDLVDQDETGLGVVVRRDHDHVPQMPRADVAVDLAGDQAVFAVDVVLVRRPFAPDHLGRIVEVDLVLFLDVHREHQRPVLVVLDRFHEAVGDQQAEVELAQAAVLALGADEFLDVRVADVERAHLRAATAAGGGHGEAHLVVDIHERQRARLVYAPAPDTYAPRGRSVENS